MTKNHNYFFASFIGFIPHFFIWNSIGAGINKFIKDISGETPDFETFLYVKDYISKYQLNIEIFSKALSKLKEQRNL